jgi:hypothetical protein
MNLATAKALADDLLDAGAHVQIEKHPFQANEWIVDATRPGNPVGPTQIANLATTHGVSAFIDRARFT